MTLNFILKKPLHLGFFNRFYFTIYSSNTRFTKIHLSSPAALTLYTCLVFPLMKPLKPCSSSLLQLNRPRSEWSNALKLLVWYVLRRREENSLRLRAVCAVCACGVLCAVCAWCCVLIQVVYTLLLPFPFSFFLFPFSFPLFYLFPGFLFPSILPQVPKDSPLDQRCGGKESRREMENVS